MSSSTLHLANCEEAFAVSPLPIWILDLESLRIVWANSVGLEFWQAATIEELTLRDMLTKIPEAVLVRLRQTVSRIKAGETFREDWTFFPKGKPMPVVLHLRPIVMRDGRIGMLNQATKIDEAASDSTVRAMAMLRHAKATIVFVDARGMILAQNAMSMSEFREAHSWKSWIVDQEMAEDILQGALTGRTIEVETTVHAASGHRVHSILAHELRDPVLGEVGILIQHFDVTERVEAERLVQTHLQRLREQQREILDLSTPFLEVEAHTLALPLIGRIDDVRASEISSRLLELVARHNIRRVILDITGVVSVNSASLAFLRRLVDAVKLLGAKPIVTGIRSDLARMLAASDENLTGITVRRSLADGLAMWRSSGHHHN